MTSAGPTTRKIWVVSELYYPEDTSTGYFLTGIAEGLALRHPVTALCSQPTYSQRGLRAPWRETHKGVVIYRCWSTAFNRTRLPLRLINLSSISVSLFFHAIWRFGRNDLVLVVTNPPLLPFLTLLACTIRRSRCLLLIHDVYPEVLVAARFARPGSLPVRVIAWLSRNLYNGMDRIIVLGRDMKRLVERKLGRSNGRIVIIENWGDVDTVRPLDRADNRLLQELDMQDRFVVQYCGNIGRTHGIETLVAAARALKDDPQIMLFVIGEGAKRQWLETTIEDENLTNVVALPRQPRDALSLTLNACDLAVISFLPGMAGVSVPSRMYNVMAAGKPILAVADEASELALVVREEQIGWVVPPGDVDALVRVILAARADRSRLAEMGRLARKVAETKYNYGRIIERFGRLVEQVS